MLVYFILPTYEREAILSQAIDAIEANIIGVEKHYVVGDDSPTGRCVELFRNVSNVTVLSGATGSLGANLNRMIRHVMSVKGELVFQMDDDHILRQRLDLSPHVEELLSPSPVGWIRLMGVAGHNYKARLKEKYWLVDWQGNELYVTSNRPHLKRLDWHTVYGMYPEGRKLGHTEESFCHQCRDLGRMFVPDAPNRSVGIPVRDHDWDHIGDSWQGKGK